MKLKMQQEIRSFSAGKITNDNRIKEMEIDNKTKDMKIVYLEGVIKDLNLNASHKNEQIKEL